MRYFLYVLISFTIISCKKDQKTKESSKKVNPIISIDTIKKAKEIVEVKAIDKNFVLGKFNYQKDTSFVKVDAIHASKTIYLQKEVYIAFIKMHEAAKAENINLKIISGTRNFYEQKRIWERKWKRYKDLSPIKRALKILEYSSMPSTSRHHWGTDMDLNNLNNSYFQRGMGAKEYQWLKENAKKYGFYQVYTSKENGRTGYNMEMWHWSYIPLAKEYLSYYNLKISYDDITGFEGSELAGELNIIKDFVNGISNGEDGIH
ncbi:M15 family metallopeptidase [Polaribacter sp. Hel1_85]|uniref:M15 family metallopeptidase n=1 Tax=Polaribacter sp. Hel1_85 TaxID=1250005 RepID=UPI00052D1257|nr:M15 family metallopeptidase [Polaribacter sp. Hel1_85]KGL62278.1 D-alanyl-D-alanine carboxypeptidase [Polaribacter sp. Hel1_85]